MKIRHLLLCMAGSCVIYAMLFLFVVRKPLTVGVMQSLFKIKYERLDTLREQTPRFIILAGSNGLSSHSAKTFEQSLGIASVNMSTTASMSIKYQLAKLKPHLHSGDIVFLPLEYSYYFTNSQFGATDAIYVLTFEKKDIRLQGWAIVYQGFVNFSLNYFLDSLVEMGLAQTGFQRRDGNSVNEYGDKFGHTEEKGMPYRNFIASTPVSEIPMPNFDSQEMKTLAEFIRWANSHEVRVIGALPVQPDDTRIDPERLRRIVEFYRTNGGWFLVLPNHSCYSRDSFYDTVYHLNEKYQLTHSRKTAEQLIRDFDFIGKKGENRNSL